MINQYRVKPGTKVKLDDWDPDKTAGFKGTKSDSKEELAQLNDKLSELQEILFAEGRHKVLVILQGTDTSGKDGAIQHVFEGVNPQGVRVASFKVPTPIELSHDYFWRIHQHTPGNGEIVIFNRSHYEDVLVVRVHELTAEKVWTKRFQHINAFEKMLADEGTTILKFFLHISLDEQKERLQARLDDPSKHWKFNVNDLKERKLWGQYQEAYEDVLSKTSKKWAPWYIVPSDHKWFRNLVIGSILVDTLKGLKMEYPKIDLDPKSIVIE